MLPNSFRKLSENHRLHVGFLGGSITEGAGASDPETRSWRALTVEWLRERFPEAAITATNAAIGGTNSTFGALRLADHLLKDEPDLIFVEYAVNDESDPEGRILRAMEGIVRHCARVLPETELIFVYTTRASWFNSHRIGRPSRAAALHQCLADFYGIPSVDVGLPLYRKFERGDATIQDLLPDKVHPSDEGHAIYAATVTGFLTVQLQRYATPNDGLPAPLTHCSYDTGCLIDAVDMADTGDGWKTVQETLCDRHPRYLEATSPGSRLTLRFQGPLIGVLWMVAEDSGRIRYRVDDGPEQVLSSWDEYALKFRRGVARLLADRLADGDHTLTLTVDDQPPGESKGTAIRLAAFLANPAPPKEGS
ncbi:MAG: GDSL-type esterase/lipase family protein [Opitutales bacterium]